jgi:elongation factor 1 alpha-like protein
MSRQRVKNMSYDDDDYDDGYDSADPEEQEILEQCTAEVLAQLLSGEPSVTASRDEVQEALWHYYNDVEKSVNYLRGKKTKETKKKQSAAPPVVAKGKGKLFAIQCLSFSVFACGWARIIRKICDLMLRPYAGIPFTSYCAVTSPSFLGQGLLS